MDLLNIQLKKVMSFQRKLIRNNSREWFEAHREEYQESEQEFRSFIQSLESAIMEHDLLDLSKTRRFRIYRDVRFSKDKTPYTLHRSVSFVRATESRRGGYYLKLQPGGNSMLAGGFWRPDPADIQHIRKHLAQDHEMLKEIIDSPEISEYFGELQGETVKSAPKGYSRDDPAIDLLRHKGFILAHPFTDDEVISDDFHLKVSDGFRRLRPFFDYMSELLTTDLNGQSLIK